MRPPLPLLVLAAALPFHACTCTDLGPPVDRAAITAPFTDDFDRAELGPEYLATEPGTWKIVAGELVGKAAHNHPLWLVRPLPRNATVDFDVWTPDADGDLKVELWGDGHSMATDLVAAYTSTAYNFIFGGWHNHISTIARMHEHGEDRQTRSDVRVEPGRRYHFTIARDGAHLDWQIDGKPFLAFDDPKPLEGDGHRYLGFADWESELHFDHLQITPNRGDLSRSPSPGKAR